jgi:hypothetical protein
MTERDRYRKEDAEFEHDVLRGPFDDDVLDKTPAERDTEEERDVDAAEGDAGLLDTDSPEFEHLQRRRQEDKA